MSALIKIGTENAPAIKGKRLGTAYFEATWNELTNKIILQLSSLVDDRVMQEEFESEEAIARWEAATGTPLFN